MVEYIPFVTTAKALKLVKTIHNNADVVRVSLELADKATLPSSHRLWLDPGVDGLDDLAMRRPRPDIERKNSWYEFMKGIRGFEKIGDPAFWARPDPKVVRDFVTDILGRAVKHKPAWITVPQLPIVGDAARNKINRMLAKATGDWKSSKHGFSGRLILPIVFTHQNQVNGKTERNPKIAQAERCYHEAHADGFWAADTSLTDESGSKTLRNTRLPAMIELHKELNQKIPSKIRIAGPYWGLNLVLWARGLIDYPAIGVGASYQYYLPGRYFESASPRVAIDPLRRRVGVADLKSWLVKAIKTLGFDHPAHKELNRIYKQLDLLNDQDNAREQVARFYKEWLDRMAATPPAGRSLALFQDLSTAYALGKSLETFAKTEGTARRPEAVVEPLMLNCL